MGVREGSCVVNESRISLHDNRDTGFTFFCRRDWLPDYLVAGGLKIICGGT